jgi:hypothetical protein
MIKKQKDKKPEKIFLEIMINGATVAKKEVKASEKMFLSILLKTKRR